MRHHLSHASQWFGFLFLTMVLAGAANAEDGAVQISSEPQGASVEMDGVIVGKTPCVVRFPKAYFRAPVTAWNNYLGAPIGLRLSLAGYRSRDVEIGEGPKVWSSWNASIRFQYYVLRGDYSFTLERIEQPAPAPAPAPLQAPATPTVSEIAATLETLNNLRRQGALTDAEFDEQKRRLLQGGPPVPSPLQPEGTTAVISQSIDPAAVCARLWPESARLAAAQRVHGLDVGTAAVLPGGKGPTVRCMWTEPRPDVSSLRLVVQCGVENAALVCSLIPNLDEAIGLDTITCSGTTKSGDRIMIVRSVCVAQAAISRSAPDAGADILSALAASISNALSPAR